ncbi:hypothetical protein TGAMA5MH_03751 [Trichoderma gamsii]|uniref:DUF2293 domain-containing protein n=1 Tax=Trichoderma gamsii TaxID=398673 RepID=A0A2K0TGG2_9HYPO|nr:hypothetical protein TGAMA5MH_03751 [Trichoderma gamsii]
MARQQTVSPEAPMPKGYGFLRKGNPFMTGLCRRKTLDAKKTLYVVVNQGKQEGLRAPKWILHQVFSEEKATRERRRGAVERRDAATEDAFATTIKRLFAKIPEEDLNKILRHALRKRSGRVGRTGKLDLDRKAYLAVQAHIRHRHTDYDKITKASKDRDAARDATRGEVSRVLVEWASDPAVMKLGSAVRKDKKGQSQKAVARVAQKRRGSLTAAIKPTTVSRRAAKQRPLSKTSKETTTQSRPVIIDLTQDEDEAEGSDAADQASSVDEDEDSEEDGDASYELSDSVGSDRDYEIDNDWLD